MKILVTGPTGTQGLPVTKELIAKGFEVKAFALESDPRLPLLKELGAEVFCGNLFDEESIFQALEGCDGIFFLPAIPSSGDEINEVTVGRNVVSAAERAGVKYMVHSSVDRAGDAVSMREAAKAIAKATGKPVVDEQWTREELLAAGGRDSVIDAQE